MTGRKQVPDENHVVIPTPDKREIDHDILKRDVPFTEAENPTMQAPEDWPPPPDDVESDDS